MNRILYKTSCRCKEESSITKKRKSKKKNRIQESNICYPEANVSKTFQIRYDKKLSPIAKLVLNSFQNKYIYYAIDDILYSFKSNPSERDNLLAILYSPVLSLQNNFCINFFDIWIHEIYINEVPKINKFLKNDSSNFEQPSYITIKLLYTRPVPLKKSYSLW
jgi:hypothetical protein